MTRYIRLAEYLWLAEQVTGVEAAVLAIAAHDVDDVDEAWTAAWLRAHAHFPR